MLLAAMHTVQESRLVTLMIYVTLTILPSYRHMEAGETQSLKLKWRERESNPGPPALQVKSYNHSTTAAPVQQNRIQNNLHLHCVFVGHSDGRH